MKTIAAVVIAILAVSVAKAQGPENILLVVNESSSVSMEVGQYYAVRRSIPAANLLRLKTSYEDEISREGYSQQIEAPIAAWLTRNNAQDRILYIVLTKGIPLRVQGSSGPEGTVASVDSELTLLYPRLAGMSFNFAGRVNNPFFLGIADISRARFFAHDQWPMYLVCRLDGYTPEDIRGLIDRGTTPSKDGKILLDQMGDRSSKGDLWLKVAAEWLQAHGWTDRVELDTGSTVLTDKSEVLGYYSWGSNDRAIRTRNFKFDFVPGALAAMFVSSDGRTFREPPAGWNIGTWENKESFYSDTPQSLAGDLIRGGVTGIAAHVAEPYLESTIRPDVLFPAYLSGYNLIEAFYLAMPALSWQTVVIGDPLCAPFRTRALTSQQVDKGIDPETTLPGYFSDRVVRFLVQSAPKDTGMDLDTAKMLVRANARLALQDPVEARRALEGATARNSRLPNAHYILATLYEQETEYDKAIEQYRRVLDLSPDNALALNNLAYSLAVRKNSPKEALAFAERAYRVLADNPSILDTLGWIYHLLGNHEKSKELLAAASSKAGGSAEIHLHYASALAALGDKANAAAALSRALALDAKLAGTEEVLRLQGKIKSF